MAEYSQKLARAIALSQREKPAGQTASQDAARERSPLAPANLESGSMPLPQLLNLLSRHLRHTVKVDGVAIVLTGEDGVRCRATCGEAPQPGISLDPKVGVCGRCYATGQPMAWVSPGEADSEYPGAVIAVPIRVGSATRGIIAGFSRDRRVFGEAETKRLQRVAEVIANQVSTEETKMAARQFAIPAEPVVNNLENETQAKPEPALEPNFTLSNSMVTSDRRALTITAIVTAIFLLIVFVGMVF